MRKYPYVGPPELLAISLKSANRCQVRRPSALLNWIKESRQPVDAHGEVTLTFIVDTNEKLWVADRCSEHVACAAGGPVLAAGELMIQLCDKHPAVTAITNQSTGFCPEPASWPVVARILDEIGFFHPSDFTTRFEFRRCPKCHSINIVKEKWFFCAVCEAKLPKDWNLGKE